MTSRLHLASALLILAAADLSAQTTSGVGDDAIPIPRGGLRFSIAGSWSSYGEVYRRTAPGGSAERTPLFGALDLPSLGTAALPQLGAAEQGIRNLTGLQSFSVSLGRLEASGQARISTMPISLEYGATRRLSFGVVIPYVEARATSQLVLNRDGTGATVGQNPAYLAGGEAARAANATVLRQIDQARTTLVSEIARCAAPAASGCDAIRANPQAAQALAAQALQTQQAIATVYGDSIARGSLIAPIAGSPVQAAVAATMGTLRSGFSQYGIDVIGENAVPVGATTVIGPAGLARIAGDTALGLGYTALGNTRRAGIGDIDLTATLLIFDSFGADQHRRLAPSGVNLRSSLTGGWRFGTGNATRTDDPFDMPIGEGANAFLARSTTDVVFGRWFWVSATARMVQPMEDEVATAFPFLTDSTVLHPFTVVPATRTLGRRLQFEIAPRLAIGEFFGISAAYQLHRHEADEFTAMIEGENAGVRTLTSDVRSLHAVAFGVSYSSLASYARRRARLPVEVFFVHTEPVGASGNNVPAIATDRLGIRFYTGFPRR